MDRWGAGTMPRADSTAPTRILAMKMLRCALVASLLLGSLSLAGLPKAYQVTGEIVELTDDQIVVMKGKERFEIARPAGLKVEGELKKGAKVTVEYRMSATTATVKADKKK